jgi:hypothetical protein
MSTAWVESLSQSFVCRHSAAYEDDAARVLDSLERTKERLERVFPRTVEDLQVILHDSPTSLVLSNPLLPVSWWATGPAGRRYVSGWVSRAELHVLSPAALRERAPAVSGAAAMLEYAAATLYTRRVIVECNRDMHRRSAPSRLAVELRWAWLLEGASRWFSGETAHARAAIARRLREGGRPSFPPGVRDAPLLGGTVIDLLAREEGELAAAQFASRLHPQGPRAALAKAFGGRALVHTEGTWRSHLARLAGAAG